MAERRLSMLERIGIAALLLAVTQTVIMVYSASKDHQPVAQAAGGCTSFVFANGKISLSPCVGSDIGSEIIVYATFSSHETDPRLWSGCTLLVRLYRKSHDEPDEQRYDCLWYAKHNKPYRQPIAASKDDPVLRIEVGWKGVYNGTSRNSDVYSWDVEKDGKFVIEHPIANSSPLSNRN